MTMSKGTYRLWGDSIGRGVVYNEARGRYCLAGERCERILQACGVPLENHARMGATIREGYADFAASETRPGDVAVIEYGGNDCDLDWDEVASRPSAVHEARTPLDEFAEMLRLFAREAQSRGMSAVMVLPPPLHSGRFFRWVSQNLDADAVLGYLGDVEHIGRWHESYVDAIREAARDTGSGLLDLHGPFLQARNFPGLMCQDGMHPNEAGQELMARVALAALRQ